VSTAVWTAAKPLRVPLLEALRTAVKPLGESV